MKIKKAIYTVVIFSSILFAASFGVVERLVISPTFQQIEEDAARNKMELLLAGFANKMASLTTIAYDWAVWDAMYRVVEKGGDDTFMAENFDSTVFEDNKAFDFAFLLRYDGIDVFSKFYDRAAGQYRPAQDIKLDGFDKLAKRQKALSGWINTNMGMALVAVQPVVPTTHKASPNGVLIVGRLLGVELISEIKKKTGHDFAVKADTRQKPLSDKTSIFQTQGGDFVVGKTVETLFDGVPVHLSFVTETPIINQGKSIIETAYIVLFACIFSLAIVVMLLFHWLLSRMQVISHKLNHISRTRNFSERIDVAGRDEMAQLGQDVDILLNEIAQYENELKETNAALEEKNRFAMDMSVRAEQASQAKSQFLANMSHEIRTPLNAVCGFAQMMEQGLYGELGGKNKEYIQAILQSGEYLMDLINDILDLNKIEAGAYELDEEAFDLRDSMTEVFKTVQKYKDANKLSLKLDIPETPLVLYADPRVIKQILYNLASNAIKFTPPGGQVCLCAKATKNNNIALVVSDTGVGVSADRRYEIFEAFVQAENTMTKKYAGSGLGLTLVSRFAEEHGAKLEVQSQKGQGSVFTVLFPAHRTISENSA